MNWENCPWQLRAGQALIPKTHYCMKWSNLCKTQWVVQNISALTKWKHVEDINLIEICLSTFQNVYEGPICYGKCLGRKWFRLKCGFLIAVWMLLLMGIADLKIRICERISKEVSHNIFTWIDTIIKVFSLALKSEYYFEKYLATLIFFTKGNLN